MFDIDAMSLEILNRPTDIRDLPEELEAVKAELWIYHEMQESLNKGLSGDPELLDYIEALQCGVDDSELEIAANTYNDRYRDLKDEIRSLKEQLEAQTRHLNIYDVTLRTCLDNEIRLEQSVATYNKALQRCHNDYLALATESTDYRDSRNMWRDAFVKLSQEQTN